VQGAKVRAQGAKVRASISASRYGMQQQHATTTTPISSTNLALTQVALIAASCCAGPIRSLVVVVVVVACCCCIPYRLALMLALTFAPCTLTFAPCTYGVSLLSTGATIPLAQVVVVSSCNLRWWCFILQPLAQIVHLHTWWLTLCNLRRWCFFIHPLAQILHLHSGNLHCVVVVCVVVVYSIYNLCINISVKMAAPWRLLNLLSYYSLCPHLRSHSIE